MTCLWKKPFERQNIFPCGPKLRQKNKELFQRLKTWWRIDSDFLTTKIMILLAPTCLAPGSCKYTLQARLSLSNFLPQMLFKLAKGEQREPKFIYRETEAIEIEVICPMPPNNTQVKVRVEQAETERSCDTWTSPNIRTSCLLFPSLSSSFLFVFHFMFHGQWLGPTMSFGMPFRKPELVQKTKDLQLVLASLSSLLLFLWTIKYN